jgi:hypothetical protein
MPNVPALLERIAAAVAFLVRNVLVVSALGATAAAAGRTLLAWLRPVGGGLEGGGGGGGRGGGGGEGRDRGAGRGSDGWRLSLDGGLETVAVAVALGLVVTAYCGLLLGLAGRLRPLPILAAVCALNVASLRGWRLLLAAAGGACGRTWRALGGSRATGGGRSGAIGMLCAVGGVVAFAPFAILTLYPPTAFDATLYHLPYARAFVATGALPFLPGLRYPIFPQLQEVLFALLMAFGDDVTTHGLSLLATVLTATLLVCWGRRLSGEAPWVAAAVYAGCPIVVYLATTAYIEAGLVLCSTAAFYSVARWRGGGGGGWLALAAVFGGAAADSKYLGLFALASVGVAAAWPRPRGETVPGWRRVLCVAAVGAVTIAPWYGRIVAATGNPVFPFLPEVFGGSPWVAREFHSLRSVAQRLFELLVDLLRAPWDVVLARRRLGGYPPYSPVVLLGAPALIPALLDRRLRPLVLAAAAYSLAVFALLPDARYLVLALPLVCLVLGEQLRRLLAAWALRRRQAPGWLPRMTAVVALACFLPGWLYAAYRLHLAGPPPVTTAGRDRFLAHAFPTYPAIRYLDRACGGSYTLYALHAENMSYFAAGRFLGEWAGPAAFSRIVPADGDPRLLYDHLRALGVDHLLAVAGEPLLPSFDSAAFRDRFRLVYADRGARLYVLRGTDCR